MCLGEYRFFTSIHTEFNQPSAMFGLMWHSLDGTKA